jgi:hypothetical protein
MALCSPFIGEGRLVPTTPERVVAVQTAEAPARMPAHSGASTQSRGGKEGIDGTGVSHCPEANHRNASFCTIPLVEKEIIL